MHFVSNYEFASTVHVVDDDGKMAAQKSYQNAKYNPILLMVRIHITIAIRQIASYGNLAILILLYSTINTCHI